jgi:hypothetical protein
MTGSRLLLPLFVYQDSFIGDIALFPELKMPLLPGEQVSYQRTSQDDDGWYDLTVLHTRTVTWQDLLHADEPLQFRMLVGEKTLESAILAWMARYPFELHPHANFTLILTEKA